MFLENIYSVFSLLKYIKLQEYNEFDLNGPSYCSLNSCYSFALFKWRDAMLIVAYKEKYVLEKWFKSKHEPTKTKATRLTDRWTDKKAKAKAD